MKTVAITGATGFLGHYLMRRLSPHYRLKCWTRSSQPSAENREWVQGELGDQDSVDTLLEDADYVVHAALFRGGGGFTTFEGDLDQFLRKNLLGSLQLFQSAYEKNVDRFVFISTCAVHDKILSDRLLDETHPLWPKSHYGAHKAALEKFVHSYGLGKDFPICALRPTGIYGVAEKPADSKWFDLIAAVKRGDTVECKRGGKEVHAADVARAVELLLEAPPEPIRGESFNCYDSYISEFEVAEIAKRLSGSSARIVGERSAPKNQISRKKLESLGMSFGGISLLEETVKQLLGLV